MASTEEAPVNPWFDGSVATAVETANTKGSVLMVCLIQDNSEGSAFEQRFLDPTIAASLSKLNLVALKLNKDSPDGVMFGQIFPIMMVPALYLIRNGLLADFMNSTVDVEQMVTRIQKAVDGHFQIPPPPNVSVQTTTPAPTAPLEAPETVPASTSPSSLAAPQPESPVVAAGSSTTDLASSSSSDVAPTTQPPEATNTPRIDNAQALRELMNERKLKREKEEQEAEKQREIDRRVSSRALAEAKKDLQEKQNRQLKEKMEKEKLAEAEYKKKVKQALEEDKARRKAEKEKAKAATAAAAAQSSPEILTPGDIRAQNAGLKEARNDAGSALAYDSSRLNIRLFDGSSIRNNFKATDTLEQVRQWIDQNQEQSDETYNIVQLIPSRTFTDESKMLRDLELCPSATLVLKKTAAASSAYSGSGDQPAASLMQYGWSALGFAGRMASSAYSTILGSEPSSSSGSSSSRSQTTDRNSKKTDREVSYNGNSTNLE